MTEQVNAGREDGKHTKEGEVMVAAVRRRRFAVLL